MICKYQSQWTKFIKDRDIICKDCGRSTGKLCSHHIIPMDYNNPWSKESDFDTDNGKLLCQACHTKIHNSIRIEEIRYNSINNNPMKNPIHKETHRISINSPEYIEKQRISHLGRNLGEKNGMFGKKSWNRGKSPSEETLQKIKVNTKKGMKRKKDLKIIKEKYQYYLSKVGE